MSSSQNKRRRTAVDEAVWAIEDAIDSAPDAEGCERIRRRLKLLLEAADAKLATMGREAAGPAPPMAAVGAAGDGSASSRSSVVSPLAVPQAEEHGVKTTRFKDAGVWGDYVGDIDADGRRHGKGKIIYEDGEVYDGDWKSDTWEGQGKIRYAHGDEYEGEFKNDRQEGQGKYRWLNGDEYEGGWKNGNRDGQGKHRKANGEEYEGGWKNNERQGWGICRLTNGGEYEGEWRNGIAHGKGKIRCVDGHIEIGGFKAGTCSGQGVRWSEDRQTAWLMNDGKVDREIGLPEAKAAASLLGFHGMPEHHGK